ISERRNINRPSPGPQTKLPARFPSLSARNQRSQNNHLESNINSSRPKHDNGLNHFLKKQARNRNQRRHRTRNQQPNHRNSSAFRKRAKLSASKDHTVASIAEQQPAGSRLQTDQAREK